MIKKLIHIWLISKNHKEASRCQFSKSRLDSCHSTSRCGVPDNMREKSDYYDDDHGGGGGGDDEDDDDSEGER